MTIQENAGQDSLKMDQLNAKLLELEALTRKLQEEKNKAEQALKDAQGITFLGKLKANWKIAASGVILGVAAGVGGAMALKAKEADTSPADQAM